MKSADKTDENWMTLQKILIYPFQVYTIAMINQKVGGVSMIAGQSCKTNISIPI